MKVLHKILQTVWSFWAIFRRQSHRIECFTKKIGHFWIRRYTLIWTAWIFFLWHSSAWGYNFYFPPYTYLSTKNAGTGGVFSPLTGNPEVIFENPASIACVRRRFSYSHSMRHFPGKIRNLDQLDADSVALVSHFTFLSLGLGFTVAGELGYDYLVRNDVVFPEEKIEGREEVRALSMGGCWLASGRSERHFHYRIRKPNYSIKETDGITSTVGKVFHPLPWLSFSRSAERGIGNPLKFFSVKASTRPDGGVSTPGLQTRQRQNWSIKLFPWWLWSSARERRDYVLSGFPIQSMEEVFLGSEIKIFGITLRVGKWNGHPTTGFSLPWGWGSLDYAEVKDVLSDITDTPLPYFRDVHMGGFTLR